MVLRLRRSTGIEHQQLKWIASAAALFALASVAATVTFVVERPTIGNLIILVAFLALPVATGVAILRYRLYDIDLIINRTLVYGTLTMLLALVYMGGVVGLGGLVRDVSGGTSNNLVVAASTLAVAALFRPARERIQSFIDRRFYRRKYNAVETIQHFSTRMRDELDLQALSEELLSVVSDAMQPSRVTLWLADSRPDRPSPSG